MIQTLKMTIAAATLGLLTGGTAQAATVSFSALIDPTLNPLARTFSGEVIQNNAVDASGVRVGPRGNGVFAYTSIGANSFAEYVFSLSSALTFVWGTPDSYNLVEFFLNGNKVDAYSGAGGGGNVGTPTVTFTDIAGGSFDMVKLSSSQRAFEFDSLSAVPAAVPVPAAGFLLIGALGGLAALRRRKTAA